MITTKSQGLSYIQYVADGVEDDFVLIFPYLYQSDIHVYIDGTETTAFTWLNSSEITMDVVPSNGQLVHIKRITNRANRIVDFTDGGVIREKTLDLDSDQLFYLSQEALDEASFALIVDNATETVDAHDSRIINVVDGVDPQDAVTKAQLDAVEVIANAADAKADAAVITADGIAATANAALVAAAAAVVTSDAADTKADAAVVTANAAEATALGIEAIALDAQATADAAELAVAGAVADAATAIADAATAQAAADAAQVDATQALADAATADAKAVAAQTDIDLLADDDAETAINNGISTGVITFDGISINADDTKFDVGAIEAWFVDSFTNPVSPTRVRVSIAAQTAIVPVHILARLNTYLGVNVSGTIIQSLTPLTSADRRTIIPLGTITHTNNINITAANNAPVFVPDTNAQLYDLIDGIGPFNMDGNKITPNGANLILNKSSGSIFKRSSNVQNDKKNPHELALPAALGTNLRYRLQDGTEYGLTTSVDPANYDLGGVLTAVPTANRWTIQRINIFQTNSVRIQYGQDYYVSKAAAVAAIDTETFVMEPAIKENAILRALMVIRAGATDLSDEADCLLLEAPKFSGISGGAGTVTTLQVGYDNSPDPEITTNAVQGAVSFKRGSAADTDSVVETQNGAGTVTSKITGEGNFTGGIVDPTRLDAKKDTKVNLDAYATIATNGQFAFATDTKKMYQIVDGVLTAVGGGGEDLSNLLTNGDFENDILAEGWTNTAGVLTSETTNVLKGTKAVKLVSSASLVNFYQSSTKNAVALASSVNGSVSIWLNNTAANVYVCARAVGALVATSNGTEITNCLPVHTDGFWSEYVLPVILGATSNGIAVVSLDPTTATATTTTGTTYFDDAKVAAGDLRKSGASCNSIECETEFSALISATTTVSNDTYNFIDGNCTNPVAGTVICTFASGKFTEAPNCVATHGDLRIPRTSTTSSSVTIYAYTTAAALSNSNGFMLKCSRSGTDFANAKRLGNNQTYTLGADSFSTDRNTLSHKTTAIVSTDPIGTYNTYSYAASSNTKTICGAAPTVLPNMTDGFKIFTRAYSAASTCGNPARVEIKIADAGTSLPTLSKEIYKNTGKGVSGNLDFVITGTSSFGGWIKSYSQTTGVATIDLATQVGGNVASNIYYEDGTSQTSGYLVINAQPIKTNATASFKEVMTVRGVNKPVNFAIRSTALCTTGTCATENFGTIATTASFVSAGVYTVNVPTGTCSDVPWCTYGGFKDTGGGASYSYICKPHPKLDGDIGIRCQNASGTAVNEMFSIDCKCSAP